MLVQWECSCIGLLLQVGKEKQAWVIWSCNQQGEYDEYSLWKRNDNLDKAYEPLPKEKAVRLLETVGTLIGEGQRLNLIRACPGVKD